MGYVGWGVFGAIALGIVIYLYLAVRKKVRTEGFLAHQVGDFVSPGGMQVVVSVGSGDIKSLPKSNDKIEVVVLNPRICDYACGHSGPKVFKLNTWGEETREFKQEASCPECVKIQIKHYVLRCAKCGLPIPPGEGVALYSLRSKGLRPEIGHVVGESVVGCLRMGCCPSGGFMAGYWTEKGFKPLHDDNLTAAELAFLSGKPVIHSKI